MTFRNSAYRILTGKERRERVVLSGSSLFATDSAAFRQQMNRWHMGISILGHLRQ